MTQAISCVAAHRVIGVVFSPDGKSVAIASSGFGSTLQLFDADSGTARWKRSSHGSGLITEVTFSADGTLLCVVEGADKATILDADDGQVVMRRRVRRHGDAAVRALISPDGTRLTTMRGGEVRVYNVRSGAETLSYGLHVPYDYCVRCSPDGTRIAALGMDGIHVRDAVSRRWKLSRPSRVVHVWDAVSGQLQARMRGAAKANLMQFGGCSHILVTAARHDSVIRVWDVASGMQTKQFDTAPGTKWLALGDGSGRVALTHCTDGTLRVWDVTSGQERTRLPSPYWFPSGAVNSDATKLAISNGKKAVKIWSIAGGPGQQPAPDAAAPDDWCPRCGAGWPIGRPRTASRPSGPAKRR